MNVDVAASILNQGIQVTLLASMPSIGLGLIVGLLVAVIQAITQIQEQTLTFVPKLIVVLVVLAATFPWMATELMDMTTILWENIPLYAR